MRGMTTSPMNAMMTKIATKIATKTQMWKSARKSPIISTLLITVDQSHCRSFPLSFVVILTNLARPTTIMVLLGLESAPQSTDNPLEAAHPSCKR